MVLGLSMALKLFRQSDYYSITAQSAGKSQVDYGFKIVDLLTAIYFAPNIVHLARKTLLKSQEDTSQGDPLELHVTLIFTSA